MGAHLNTLAPAATWSEAMENLPEKGIGDLALGVEDLLGHSGRETPSRSDRGVQAMMRFAAHGYWHPTAIFVQ